MHGQNHIKIAMILYVVSKQRTQCSELNLFPKPLILF